MDESIDDIIDAIEGEIDKEILKKKLEEYLSYGVPPDQAKQTILKQYSGTSRNFFPKTLKEVKPNEKDLNLVCQIVTINPKEVEVKGEKRKIFYGFIGDETAVHTFTSWKDFDLNKGDVIQITNAYSKEWQKEPQINLSETTEIKKLDPSAIKFVARIPVLAKIMNLKEGMGNVEVTGRLLTLEERKVTARGQEKTVYSGIMGDTTGKIPYTSWKNFSLKEQDVIKVTNGYIKSWRGAPQLIFDENSQVEKLSQDKVPLDSITTPRVPISLLVERGGGMEIKVVGTIIEVRKDSGLIFRCPDCNRALKNGICGIHGEVEGQADLRIKATLDDGTGSINAILNRELTENILGMNLKECRKVAEEAMTYEVIANKIDDMIFAHPVQIIGNAFSDEFGVTFIAKEASIFAFDVQKEVSEMLKEVGE